MKSENENWSKQLAENQINIDQIKNKTSQLLFEKDNLESLIFDGKLVQFKESADHDLGEVYSNELDIFDSNKVKTMDLSGHFKDKEEEEEEECSHYLATFTSDGDIIMISFGRYTFERANYVTLKIFDINKNVVKKRQDIDE